MQDCNAHMIIFIEYVHYKREILLLLLLLLLFPQQSACCCRLA